MYEHHFIRVDDVSFRLWHTRAMRKIQLSYSIAQQRPKGPALGAALLRNPLIDLLQAVRNQGSISGAARLIGLSYRHVWGQLKEWEQELGQPLILWERGQAAQLSPFGQRLLMAERLAQARLGPQTEALRAELERAFSLAFEDSETAPSDLLTLYASHDHALTVLQEVAAGMTPATVPSRPNLHLDIRFTGSVDAIRALNEGRCQLAAFHTQPFAAAGSLSARTYRPLLKPGTHKIIGFARRAQGLMVAPGNPLRLNELRDVVSTRARFVNRSRGTGTRLLLDELLAQGGLAAESLMGYDRDEASHAAVAQAIAAGEADVGLGTLYAARDYGLGFVPLTDERYLLVSLKSALEQPAMLKLLALLRSRTWQDTLNALPGYATDHCGEVAAMKRLLPWWD